MIRWRANARSIFHISRGSTACEKEVSAPPRDTYSYGLEIFLQAAISGLAVKKRYQLYYSIIQKESDSSYWCRDLVLLLCVPFDSGK